MNILLASPYLKTFRGNNITTLRLQKNLNKLNNNVQIIDYNECDINKCTDAVINNDIIHILNPVRYLLSEMYQNKLHENKVYCITFTGTDINEHLDEANFELYKLLSNADFLVVFHEQSYLKLVAAFPTLIDKVHIIEQGFFKLGNDDINDLNDNRNSNHNYIDSIEKNNHVKENILLNEIKTVQDNGSIVAILPAGIREVKGISNAINLIINYREIYNRQIKLYIVGPIIEEKEMSKIQEQLDGIDFIIHFDEIDHHLLLEAIGQADILINSSESEGQSIAIIEAFYHKTIVIASRCAGNEQMINNNINGFLYDNRQQFFDAINNVINDDKLVNKIIDTAYVEAKMKYSADVEAKKYQELYKRSIELCRQKCYQ